MNTLITDTTIITMNKGRILEHASIGCEDGIITYLDVSEPDDISAYEMVIEGSDYIIMPGMINSHFHSTSTLLKGMAQDVPESEWMMKALAPLSQYLTHEDRILGSKLAVLEGIRTGTTSFAEFSSNVESLWESVYQPLGARMIGAETINEIVSDKTRQKSGDLYELDYDKGEVAFQRSKSLIDHSETSDRLSMLLGPQAIDMVSQERLHQIQELSREHSIPIHMHVAQGQRERSQIEKRYGMSTISTLEKLDFLNSRLIAAHCHDTTDKELTIMAENSVNMVSCQSSIGMIDGIVPPLFQYKKLGGKVAIGTDQVPGVGHANLFREMRTASQFAKITHQDPTALPPWEVMKHTTSIASEVFGQSDRMGSLVIGKHADLIMIDKTSISINPIVHKPIRTILPNLIYSSTGYEVSDVFIQGKQILTGGEFEGIDYQSLVKRSFLRSREIVEEAEDDWRDVDSQMVRFADSFL